MSKQICTKCKIEKEAVEFHKDSTKKQGYGKRCKKCKNDYSSIYRKKNKNYYKEYRKNNEKSIKEYRKSDVYKIKINIYKKKKRKENIMFKLKANLRTRVYSLMVGKYEKNSTTEELLGAKYETVKQYIESTFQDGMNWDNYGACKGDKCDEVWHIDHKIPLASANTQKEIEKLFHYTNLQALWAIDNIIKGNRVI